MTTKVLIVLAALTLCCCISSLQASPIQGCLCIRTTSASIPARVIKKVEVIPVSGRCRRTEIIVTRKNGSNVCVDPNGKWARNMLNTLNRQSTTDNTTLSSTSVIN
ncbi:C-X-C motif chemokine 13 [Cheilinus undulatus]|uniref:C-X-C motif chemokine 13 n=1 Tax=Cheilinus undulatus TaxID=241271 RepID=UPI001BD3FD71|nr:C-X-C motif chemokine 13 [Cheilinus undulatus]